MEKAKRAILVDFSTPAWVKVAAEGGAECDRRREACVQSRNPVFQTPLRLLSCTRLGFPIFLGSTERLNLGQGLGIECLVRITLAQGQAHPPVLINYRIKKTKKEAVYEGKEGNCGPVGAACTNERLCNDLAPDGFFKGPGVAKRYCTTNSIGDSFLQRRPGTVPFPPAYGPLALELGHWDGGSQRRCKWPLCGLRFAVSYASTGETPRLDSPMLPSSLSDFRGHTERASLVYGESI